MSAAFLSYAFLALCLFYLQNLVYFPHVHLRLLALLLFYVGLRPSLALSLALALVLGALQDSFATTPFGLHLGAALVLVAAARFFRQRLLWQHLGSQVLASLVALVLQEVFMQVSLMTVGYEGFFFKDLLLHHGVEILGTAALGPLMYLLVGAVETFLRHFGWRPGNEPSQYQPFS
ncbi:MAG: rod shape-determining protein MreD [Deltaproteobacteria bacterium]|nr:rod shape-determining protein MreD [Deltaproteobacteria bacterium]